MNRESILWPARSVLHIFRKATQKLLGISGVVQAHNSSVRQVGPLRTNEIYQRLLDRVCLLESHVNWRLLGLPSQVGNVRLEQSAALSDHQDLMSIIQMITASRFDEYEGLWVRGKVLKANRALVVGSYNLFGGRVDWGDNFHRCTILQDPDDVSSMTWELESAKSIVAGPLSYLLASDDNSHDFIWLGNSLLRSAPLHRLLILQNALRVLSPQGCLAGLLQPKNDIQFQAAIDWSAAEAVGFPIDKLEMRENIYEFLKD